MPGFQPLPLARRREPFTRPVWVYEVKCHGFRSLAYAERGTVRLVSRSGNVFASFRGLAEGMGRG